MTIPELEESMTPQELLEWMAYYRLEPWGEGPAAIRHAELMVAIKGGSMADYLPKT